MRLKITTTEEAIVAHNKVQNIKDIRSLTGCSLYDAKAITDKLLEQVGNTSTIPVVGSVDPQYTIQSLQSTGFIIETIETVVGAEDLLREAAILAVRDTRYNLALSIMDILVREF